MNHIKTYGPYLLIIVLGFVGFQYAGDERERNEAASRARGQEHRMVTAAVVCGIQTLISDLIAPPAGRELDPDEKAALDRIVKRLGRFRTEQLDALNIKQEQVEECSR